MLDSAEDIKLEVEMYDGNVVAVSKTFGVDSVRAAYELGFRDFGENYAAEAVEKIEVLKDLDIKWHFLGRVQSGTINKIVNKFDLIHTMVKVPHLKKINDKSEKPQKVLIQIKHPNDPRDYGVTEDELVSFVNEAKRLPNIILAGIMFIPPVDMEKVHLKAAFLWAKEQFKEASSLLGTERVSQFDVLSMGMSGDYEIALENGSTHVRIGRAIFGDRERKD